MHFTLRDADVATCESLKIYGTNPMYTASVYVVMDIIHGIDLLEYIIIHLCFMLNLQHKIRYLKKSMLRPEELGVVWRIILKWILEK
jgi:hypothetical protein